MTETFRLTPRTPAEKLRNCADLLLRPRIDKQLRAGIAITLRQVAEELEREALRTPATPKAKPLPTQATATEAPHGPQFRWILNDGDNDWGRWHDLEGDCGGCCCSGAMDRDCGGREHHEPVEKPGGGTMHDWVCQTCRMTTSGDPARVEER